jgi:hypothetical protein
VVLWLEVSAQQLEFAGTLERVVKNCETELLTLSVDEENIAGMRA